MPRDCTAPASQRPHDVQSTVRSASNTNETTTTQMPKKTAKSAKKFQNTNAPAAVGTRVNNKKQPAVQYRQDGSCRVSHVEYVADIDSPNAFESTSGYPVNPQRSQVFTWLSAVATRFEMYRFHKLKFIYKPSCGTAADGYVILGFDFDYYDSAPNKNAVLAWKYSSKSAVWQSNMLDVSADSRMATMRYCNTNPSQGDHRLDMLGNLWVLRQSGSTLSLGEIFVDYDVEFRQPAYKIPPALYYHVESEPNQDPTTPFANVATELGNMVVEKVGDGITFLLKDAGQYLVDVIMQGSGMTTPVNIAFATPAGNPSTSFTEEWLNDVVNAGTKSVQRQLLNVIVPPVLMTVDNSTGNGGTMKTDLRVATYATSSG